ncbi:MAG: histidine kinase [Polyangiaceae bacterium]
MNEKRRWSAIDWLVGPWVDGSRWTRRATRVLAVSGALVVTVLPAMMLYFGLDGWWWDQSLSVVLLGPLGLVAFDWLGERVAAQAAPRWRPTIRVAALGGGIAAGVFAGYAVTLAFRMTPDRTVGMVVRDYGRTMSILTPVVAVLGIAGASLWYRAEAYRLEGAAATASFHALKGQMQPHFLFNSLNALKELIAEDPTLASEFTQHLADLYRILIRVSTEVTSLVDDELAMVAHYLEVERVRFGDRLRFRVEPAGATGRRYVPTLMVQTLVENAVKHGIAKARGGGEIVVRAIPLDGGRLTVEVSNTGAPYAPNAADPAATGLANTRARLALMYGDAGALDVGASADGGTVARVTVSGERIA